MKQPPFALMTLAALLAQTASVLAAPPALPAGIREPVSVRVTDGVTDDLLTAGLGKTGLMGAAPTYANPAAPTADELRRNAIYNNYRALVDATAGGGMGVLYGPNIDVNGQNTLGEGKIAGWEVTAWMDDGTGQQNVSLMVQVPTSFDVKKPCIVTGTSSGSRGIYGAIGTSGDWGLKHGCAVAYTDKGGGNGFHDLMTGKVTARNGTLLDAATAGTEALFIASGDLAAFNAATPNRMAYKHAHSGQHPEADWGQHTLQSIRFAFYVLNAQFGDAKTRFKPGNTLVIASSVSNGGGAAIMAAEQDREGLIDGVAVSEPNVQQMLGTSGLRIEQGGQPVGRIGMPLVDYFTWANVFQPCAVLSPQAGIPVSAAFWPAAYTSAAANRCAALAAKGLVSGKTQAQWADSALAKLRSHGWQAESDFYQASHYRFATNSIAVTYVNALGRFGVTDRICGFSYAATDASGNVVAQNPVTQAGLFASGNGVPPTSGVNIVYDDAVGGAKLDFLGTSPSSNTADFSLDGALCLRSLVVGRDVATGAALTGTMKTQSDRVQQGLSELRLRGVLRGKPTLIVAGRNDALLPVNHAARAYFGLNQLKDPNAAKTRYIEVTNAQHFDSFIGFGALLGYDTRTIPLHVYFNRAMDAMWSYLSAGTPLPPSQVVRTVARGGVSGAAPAITAANVPAIAATPASGDAISMNGKTLVVPN